MKASIIKDRAGLSMCINGEKVSPVAYMTYLENNADYEGFKNADYNLFCACVYMGDGPINEVSGVHCFGDHVWKAKDCYDFTPVYESVKKIVGDGSQKTYVMLRVNLNAPRWWREENPEELLVPSGNPNKTYMQSFFSKKWRADVERFLDKLCSYLKEFTFSENVVALQLAGMQTEEWLAYRGADGGFDYSLPAQKAYAEWLKNKYKTDVNAYLPTEEEINGRHVGMVVDGEKYRNIVDYTQFYNYSQAMVIKELCAYAKQCVGGDLLVGTFYGYFGQLPCEFGHSAVSLLLKDSNVDFFASPFAYVGARQTAEDWIYHGVMDSCTLAGKLWFLEADVRTYRTKGLAETNPELMAGERTVKHHSHPVWFGPKTEEESLWVMLRSFAKVLCSGHAFWWFDMWGGWYNTPVMMDFMRRCRALYEKAYGEEKHNELAVIMDEEGSYGLSEEYYTHIVKEQLIELGFVGASYDMYHKIDEGYAMGKYKAYLYLAPSKENFKGNLLRTDGERMEKATIFTAEEIGSVMQRTGAHIYSAGNIVYANDKFVCVTAAKEGEVQLTMPKACKLKGFLDGKIYEGRQFTFRFAYNQTELFEIVE